MDRSRIASILRPKMLSVSPATWRMRDVPGSTAINIPCGWMEPGIWIGSRSQLLRSTVDANPGIYGCYPRPLRFTMQPDDTRYEASYVKNACCCDSVTVRGTSLARACFGCLLRL